MEKIVYKIVGFMVVLGFIITMLEKCQDSLADRLLDIFLNPLTSCDRQKYIDEIEKDKAKNPAEFIGICITQIGIYNNDITNINSTNINIQQDFKSVNTIVNNYNQKISNHYSLINKITDETTIINWIEQHNTYKNDLDNRYNELKARIDALKKDQKELEDKIKSLEIEISSYAYQETDLISRDQFRKKIEELKNNILELENKTNSLTKEIKTSTIKLKDIKRSIDKCIDEIKKINEKLEKKLGRDSKGLGGNEGTGPEEKTYYYIIGSEDELKEKEIVSSGGLFGGLKVNPNPNKDLFVFLSEKDKSILLGSEESEFDVISDIPADSYDIRVVNKAKILVIKDLKTFWSKTEFLVIIKQ